MLWIWPQGLYTQNFIFFVTYEWAKKARVFANDNPFQSYFMKHSCLMGPFSRYGLNEVFAQSFIFFITPLLKNEPSKLERFSMATLFSLVLWNTLICWLNGGFQKSAKRNNFLCFLVSKLKKTFFSSSLTPLRNKLVRLSLANFIGLAWCGIH